MTNKNDSKKDDSKKDHSKKDHSKKHHIKSPDPTSSLIFFFIVTCIFTVLKYTTTKTSTLPCNDKGSIGSPASVESMAMTGGYIILLIIGNFFINLNITSTICGEAQWKNTFINTLIPWVIIFGILNLLLMIYPAWLSPFSNTIGYGVAKLFGLKDTIEAIFKPKDMEGKSNPSQSEKNIAQALERIYSDPSLVINEITLGNFCNFWNNMKKAGMFKDKIENENQEMINLYNFIKIKDITSEFVWNILGGSLVTSVGYNYIINSGCDRSIKKMEQRHNDYLDKQAELHEAEKTKKKRVYTFS